MVSVKKLRTFCCLVMAGTAIAVSLSGCTSLSTPGASSGQPMVLLPIAAAGVTDSRQAFATQFGHELRQEGTSPDLSAWLHPIPEAASAAAALSTPLLGTSVLIVPGILGECVDGQALPFSDGVTRPRPQNYVEGYRKYLPDLGGVRAIQVGGRASSEANAQLVIAAVKAEAASSDVETIILVTYSKGLPDTLVAIQQMQARAELPTKIKALVSVSGVLLGTPVADEFKGYYEKLVAPFKQLGCPESFGGEVESLTVKTRTNWLAATPIPPQIATFSVVAHASREAIAPTLQPFFDMLSRIDPLNDGQVYASWSILPRAHLLAEVRSDHWTYVLALEKSEDSLVRALSSGRTFPREAFFRAMVKSVAAEVMH
ncbi:hypothetical protein ABN448_05120 [Delftia acidovorans]|uniref:hypothetical protein n=1 Tax=Delftia acidovorans TaxID=80866 RepID=UPI0032DF5205